MNVTLQIFVQKCKIGPPPKCQKKACPDDPLYEDLNDEQIETMVVAMKYEQKMKQIKERRSRR